jgi:hypothetical protein
MDVSAWIKYINRPYIFSKLRDDILDISININYGTFIVCRIIFAKQSILVRNVNYLPTDLKELTYTTADADKFINWLKKQHNIQD